MIISIYTKQEINKETINIHPDDIIAILSDIVLEYSYFTEGNCLIFNWFSLIHNGGDCRKPVGDVLCKSGSVELLHHIYWNVMTCTFFISFIICIILLYLETLETNCSITNTRFLLLKTTSDIEKKYNTYTISTESLKSKHVLLNVTLLKTSFLG